MCTLRRTQDDPLELQEETDIIPTSINLLLLKFLSYVGQCAENGSNRLQIYAL